MPRSQGRIVVAPNAPRQILLDLMPMGTSEALSRKLASPRAEGVDVSISSSPSPRQRPRLPGGHIVSESPKAVPREAWGSAAGTGTGYASRAAGAQKARRPGSVPHAPQVSVEFHGNSLFGGDRNANPKTKRAYATTFRRPTSSRAPVHQRPIFLVGPDGSDPKMCVDINAPQRFSSAERMRYELAWRNAKTVLDEGSRPSATLSNIGGLSGPPSGRASAVGRVEGRSSTPIRPGSVGSVPTCRASSGIPGQRPPLARPMSSNPVQRSWSSPAGPPPVPASWSGA